LELGTKIFGVGAGWGGAVLCQGRFYVGAGRAQHRAAVGMGIPMGIPMDMGVG